MVTNANAFAVGKAYYLSVNRRQSTVWFENLPGIVNIYFDFLPGASAWGSKITVKDQNNSIVASTDVSHNNVSALTAADKTFLTTSPRAVDFTNAITRSNYDTSAYRRSSDPDDRDYGMGSGKIQLSTSGGGKFVITVDSLDPSPNYKILVEFPSVFSADTNIVNDPSCDPSPPVFVGTMESGELTMNQWSCSNIFRVNATGYKAFVINCTGLKANTVHKFYVDTEWWPEVVLLTQSLFDAAHDPDIYQRDRAESLRAANPEYLFISGGSVEVNEVAKFLTLAMNKLYNADGSPGPATVLKSDRYGKLRFIVFFPLNLAGWFSQDFHAESYRLDYRGYDISAYQDQYLRPTYGSSGYTALVIQDGTGTSQASRIFANRTPNKTIPYDSRGNI